MFMLAHFLPPLFDNTGHKGAFLGEFDSAILVRRGLSPNLANKSPLPADYLSYGQERCQGNHLHHTCSFTQ